MRLINRLVEASGGWERFLYQTLKDVCDKVGEFGFTGQGEESIEDAQEILEAYTTTRLGKPTQRPCTPVQKIVEEDRKVQDAANKIDKPEKIFEAAAETNATPKEITCFQPAPRPAPKSRELKAKIGVDADAGASQGGLPMPAGFKITNRQNLLIGSKGLEFGRGSDDGQVRGRGVSGHVSVAGKYRLVFKETDIGVADVRYEVEEIPSKITKKAFEEAVALRNDLSIPEFRESLKDLSKVVIPCGCGAELCFGWLIEDQSEIDNMASAEKQKIQARRLEYEASQRYIPQS